MSKDSFEASTPFEGIIRFIGLAPNQWQRLVLFLLVLAFVLHVGWMCGWWETYGLQVPYAKRSEFTEVRTGLEYLKELSTARELREQFDLRCREKDQDARFGQANAIERLEIEYQHITNSRYPDPGCHRD